MRWCSGDSLAQHLIEHELCLVLVRTLSQGKLTDEDLTCLGQHALLACRQAAVTIAAPEITNNLGDLVHVAGSELLAVCLVPTRPVGRFLGVRGTKYFENAVETLLADDVTNANNLGIFCRNE